MLPHKHFLIAGLVIAPITIVLFPEKSISQISEWILVGGFISMAQDLDTYTLVLLKSKNNSKLKPFINPIEIHRHFKVFMDTITETGILKVAMKTHFIFSALIILFFCLFKSGYLLPVVLGVVSHLISDIPNLKKITIVHK